MEEEKPQSEFFVMQAWKVFEEKGNEDSFHFPTKKTEKVKLYEISFVSKEKAEECADRKRQLIKPDSTTFYEVHHVKMPTDPKRSVVLDCLDSNGDYFKVYCGAKKVVCPTCEGDGTIVNPNIDGNGISMDDQGCDPEFFEEYFKGKYDIRCIECNGFNVILQANVESLPLDIRSCVERHQREEWNAFLERKGEMRGQW